MLTTTQPPDLQTELTDAIKDLRVYLAIKHPTIVPERERVGLLAGQVKKVPVLRFLGQAHVAEFSRRQQALCDVMDRVPDDHPLAEAVDMLCPPSAGVLWPADGFHNEYIEDVPAVAVKVLNEALQYIELVTGTDAEPAGDPSGQKQLGTRSGRARVSDRRSGCRCLGGRGRWGDRRRGTGRHRAAVPPGGR